MERHPSRLELDRALVDPGDERARAVLTHAESCDRCARQLARAKEQDVAFLEAFPTPAALQREPAALERQPASVLDPRDRVRLWWLGGGSALVMAAAVVIAILIFPRDEVRRQLPGTSPADTIRLKGDTVVEWGVKRGERSFPWRGERLQAGDVLAFRYTTKQRYLLVFSVEESGRVSVFFADDSGQRSRLITPGRRVTLGKGVKLDEYEGAERLFVLFSKAPVSVEAVKRALAARLAALRGAARGRLELGELGLSGEVQSWLITRERAP